jgi:tRNA-splicing endonuclease subunit Sen34
MANDAPELPVPISLISGRYMLFSADTVTYLRREHNITGVLIGTLPQIPQQNVFLGLPLELMPEEARLLVEKGLAYVVDDAATHTKGFDNLADEDRKRYLNELERLGRQASTTLASRKEQQREKMLKKAHKTKSTQVDSVHGSDSVDNDQQDADDYLFSSPRSVSEETSSSGGSVAANRTFGVTPASSELLFPNPQALPPASPLPDVPPSYPLYAHLHSEGYFLSPGLRFGCQYMAYPGDPLRFHSHFLVNSAEWDEEIDLMDLVAGGRLGTGVKKGYLIGGAEKSVDPGRIRTFSLEWAGM